MAAGRIFQGLNRAEVKTILSHEVRDELVAKLQSYGDSELDIRFDYALELTAYPAETDLIRKAFTGRVKGIASALPEALADFVKMELDKDSTFAGHLTFPKVSWSWTMNLTAARDQVVDVPAPVAHPIVSADHKDVDFRPLSQRVSDQATEPPPDLAKLADPHSDGIRRATNRMLSLGQNEPGTADRRAQEIATIRETQRQFEAERSAPSKLEDRLDRLERMIAALAEGQALRPAAAAVDRSLEITADQARRIAATRPTVIANVPRETPTGLPITGGAKPSPGADAAASYGTGSQVGSVQGTVVIDRLAADVSHDPLEAGGIGAPDAVRRQHDLPVPQPQEVTRDGRVLTVADLPAGTF